MGDGPPSSLPALDGHDGLGEEEPLMTPKRTRSTLRSLMAATLSLILACAGWTWTASPARGDLLPLNLPISGLLRALLSARPLDNLGLIVCYKSAPGILERTLILSLGGQIVRELKIVQGYQVRISAASVLTLATSPNISWISLDAPIRTSMDVARQTEGIPSDGSALSAYTGSGVTVAVLDSGVASHGDLKGRI